MNSWLRLPNHSWPCSTGSSCPAARRSVAFAALFTPAAVEALRVLFLEDLLTRPLTKERQRGELLDRAGRQWEVFDIDGTELRQPANVPYPRQRICLPPSVGWMRSVLLATPGASVGKLSALAPSFHKPTPESRLGSFGNRGNGEYRKELASALGAIRRYLAANSLPQARALLRLDGLYGTGAVMADLDGLCFVIRGKDYTVLDHPTVQARLHLPPDAHFSRPESILVRTLYDCPDVPVGEDGLPLPRRGGDPSGYREKKPHRSHPRGCGLRTLFHPSPARWLHRL